MITKPAASRRTFFGKAGAALLAPLAATRALAGEQPGDDLAKRLAALEDADAIRGLLQRHVQSVNAGTSAAPDAHVRALNLDSEIAIEVLGDGTATAKVGCSVATATPIVGGDTLVEMARLQGDGVLKRHERRVLVGSLAKRRGMWQIERLELRA